MQNSKSKNVHPSPGFTLLEIMIALVILSLSLLSLYGAMGNSLNASRMAEGTDQAVLLARQKMSETLMSLEEDIARGAFPDGKEESGTFEKPFENYRWSHKIAKVSIPAIHLP